ncbi:hypothetical protein ACFE04_001952 [Oxalis oulophora]
MLMLWKYLCEKKRKGRCRPQVLDEFTADLRELGLTDMDIHKDKKSANVSIEGNLAEAKEELKKAKILEKQLEEQELLGGDDDNFDDELSALINNMDDDIKDDF